MRPSFGSDSFHLCFPRVLYQYVFTEFLRLHELSYFYVLRIVLGEKFIQLRVNKFVQYTESM